MCWSACQQLWCLWRRLSVPARTVTAAVVESFKASTSLLVFLAVEVEGVDLERSPEALLDRLLPKDIPFLQRIRRSTK